jgi:competence protein ComEA
MLKKILALVAMLYAAACFAAVDVNKATAAELDGIKGIGPSISTKILDERKKGNFKDWTDLIDRVKGIGQGNAAKFSVEGLTVNGAEFKSATAAAKKDEKKADAKTAAPAIAVAPAAATSAAPAKDSKVDAKAEAKAKAAADKEAAKQVKADAKAAKAAAKADKAKPAASAASAAKK